MTAKASFSASEFPAIWAEFASWLQILRQQGNLLTQIKREDRLAGKKLVETALHLPHSLPRWTLLPLPESTTLLLEARGRYRHIKIPTPELRQYWKDLQRYGYSAYKDSEPLAQRQNSILNPQVKIKAETAATLLWQLYQHGKNLDFPKQMQEISASCMPAAPADLADAFSPQYGLVPLLTLSNAENEKTSAAMDSPPQNSFSTPAQFSTCNLDRAEFADLPQIIEKLDALARELNKIQGDCLKLANSLREEAMRKELEKVPLQQLQDISKRRMKLSTLEENGIKNAAEVAALGWNINHIAGVGDTSASQILSALRALQSAILEETPVRFDPENHSPVATELLQKVYTWYQTKINLRHSRAFSFAASLKAHAYYLGNNASRLLVIGRARSAEYFVELLEECRQVAAKYQSLPTPTPKSDAEIWEHFLAEPAAYYAQMAELGILTSDSEKIRGELPAEIVERVNSLHLHTEYIRTPLRGYQMFGAKFALTQRKVIIGDEMGLGKTIESLAVIAHLFEEGKKHFLVVCPASVLTNWLREIATKTDLPSYRLHGTGKKENLRRWNKLGGIAVSTYETLGWLLQDQSETLPALACTVVDEAHYIKNSDAKRSLRTARLVAGAEYALLLSGTPLENRIDEFRTLVHYVRPDLAISASSVPRKFRREVAPVYLRRTQSDTLTELPEILEIEEWLPMSPIDESNYKDAVESGNFMAMRQAAMLSADSIKIARIQDIVSEAKANGKRIIIYSFFRTVLDRLSREIPESFGPLTGSVSPDKRQEIVDSFSDAPAGSVLLTQIMAGGVGLNIQAASVVIICEPQLKPTTEWQAIARAHRMGQLDKVQVHRLISEVGVDAQLTSLLERKSNLFQKFAHISETAQASALLDPESSAFAAEILSRERIRLGLSTQSEGESGISLGKTSTIGNIMN